VKALRYILLSLVIAAAVGLLAYEIIVHKKLDSGNLVRCILIIAGAVLAMLKPAKKAPPVNKKALYQKAYSQFIQNPFAEEPKLEKKFYDAVHDYNRNKPSSGLAKLEKLRKECQRSGDLYSVTVFTALCLDDMGQYKEAIRQYDAAAHIRPCSTLYSNMGLCYQRMGDYEASEAAYLNAIKVDEHNAFAWNNLSALYFRRGEYGQALDYAEQAIEIDPKMPQPLATAAICCALLDERDDYEHYYRQAVSVGYDGQKIKNAIRSLDPAL
jgi:tetratricopeptide (TPR) repeat protein